MQEVLSDLLAENIIGIAENPAEELFGNYFNLLPIIPLLHAGSKSGAASNPRRRHAPLPHGNPLQPVADRALAGAVPAGHTQAPDTTLIIRNGGRPPTAVPTTELEAFLSPVPETSVPHNSWPAMIILQQTGRNPRAIRTAIAPDGTLTPMCEPASGRSPEAVAHLWRHLETCDGMDHADRAARTAELFGLTAAP